MQKPIVRSTLAVALWLSLLLPQTHPAHAHSFADTDAPSAVPAGFSDSPVVTLPGSPLITDLELTPDGGRLLITTQTGRMLVFNTATSALLATPALDLQTAGTVCYDGERGLHSVLVDPAFATNKYIYVYYTWNGAASGGDPQCSENPAARNRAVRYTLNDNNTTSDPLLILGNIPTPCGFHNGGDMQFGADGLLYISVGDGGCRLESTGMGGDLNNNSRFRSILNGKILRLNKDGSIPASNPYASDPNGIVCGGIVNQTKNTTQRCKETYAWGLRNPFKIPFRHGTNEFRINDVGQSAREEVNAGSMNLDYGWNCVEGSYVTPDACSPTPGGLQVPLLEYDHTAGNCAIVGGAFATSANWPTPYRNAYFFGDYCANKIYTLNEGGSSYNSQVTFATLGVAPVALMFDPATSALFYGSSAGVVRKITYGSSNRAPNASATASPTSGAVPLAVSFDGSASSDPDGNPITGRWNFGDGTSATTLVTSHTYNQAGLYTASLVVTDSAGLTSAPWTVQINAGNDPPQPVINAPAINARFAVGQVFVLNGSATDPQDGALSDSRLSWSVLLHHVPQSQPQNNHTHPFFSGTGNNLTLPAMPQPEDMDAAPLGYIEIRLTATDLQGLAKTVTQTLLPNRVPVTFVTQPGGLQLSVSAVALIGPQTLTTWANQNLSLNAPSPQTLSANSYGFTAWSDGGAASHTTVAPASAANLTATYTLIAGPTAIPTATPIATLVATPSKTPTTQPNSTPTRTPSPTPTGTPRPSPTPLPTATPTPDFCAPVSIQPNANIPDNNPAYSCFDVVVNDMGLVTSATLRVALTHTFAGDLRLQLRSPNSMTLTLLNRPGHPANKYGDSSNLSGASPITFTSASTASAEAMGNNLLNTSVICRADKRCVFSPNPDGDSSSLTNSFTGFVGLMSKGTWRVCVSDAYAKDIGSLRSATLDLACAAPPGTTPPVTVNVVPPAPTAESSGEKPEEVQFDLWLAIVLR